MVHRWPPRRSSSSPTTSAILVPRRPSGRAGLDNILATYPNGQEPRLHALMDVMREACRERRPKLLILDNIAQLFGGNENDRFQVSHFCNAVGGLAREFDCAVLLLRHPGKAEGSEYSGSTAWSAAVRSRLLLQRGQEDELVLARVKSNYAVPDTMPMEWADGVLRPAGGGGGGAEMPDLKTLGPEHQVTAIRQCEDTYHVATADGADEPYWEFNLRFKTDGSELGPAPGKPVIVGAGMMGDRASVVFASPAEISPFIKEECPA